MPVNGIVTSRSVGVTVPGGTHGSPWLQRESFPLRVARTYVVAHGAQLLRAADAESSSGRDISRPPSSTA